MIPRRALFSLALLVVLGFLAPEALAFRPSSRWLLDQAARLQLERKVRTLKVEQEAVVYDLETAPKGFVAQERTWFFAPARMRNELELPGGVRTLVITPKQQLLKEPGKPDRVLKKSPSVFVRFLGGGPPLERAELADQLLDDLKKMHVDLDLVSYGRFDGRVAYVIGAKPYETDKPQIWLDKDALLLLRVIEVEPGAGEKRKLRREIRLLGYGSPEGGNWYPKVIERWENDTLVQRSVTRAVERNEPLDEALFAIR